MMMSDIAFDIKQLLTKEMTQNGFDLCTLPHDFYKVYKNCDVEKIIMLDKLKRKRLPKIIRFAMMGDIPEDLKGKLADEEIMIFDGIRELIKKYEEV